MPDSSYPGHLLLGEGSESSSSENTGSQIQYDQRSWLNIHTKTHHLLYLGLSLIFNLYKWSLELFSNHRPKHIGGCVHTRSWVGFYFHTHLALTTLLRYHTMVKWLKDVIFIQKSFGQQGSQQRGTHSTSQTKHIARYVQRDFRTSTRLERQVLYKHYLATVLPVTTGKASGRKFPFSVSPPPL